MTLDILATHFSTKGLIYRMSQTHLTVFDMK